MTRSSYHLRVVMLTTAVPYCTYQAAAGVAAVPISRRLLIWPPTLALRHWQHLQPPHSLL